MDLPSPLNSNHCLLQDRVFKWVVSSNNVASLDCGKRTWAREQGKTQRVARTASLPLLVLSKESSASIPQMFCLAGQNVVYLSGAGSCPGLRTFKIVLQHLYCYLRSPSYCICFSEQIFSQIHFCFLASLEVMAQFLRILANQGRVWTIELGNLQGTGPIGDAR